MKNIVNEDKVRISLKETCIRVTTIRILGKCPQIITEISNKYNEL